MTLSLKLEQGGVYALVFNNYMDVMYGVGAFMGFFIGMLIVYEVYERMEK